MSDSLGFTHLPPAQARRFIPAQADFNDPEQVQSLYRALLERPCESTADLEQFLLHRSELEAALRQHGSVLYIRMTAQTDDEARAAAYRRFVEGVKPVISGHTHQLNVAYLNARDHLGDHPAQYAVYERRLRADVTRFREENIALQTQESLLNQEYQTLTGGLSAQFEGEEVTLSKLDALLYETDRSRREAAWRAALECRYAIHEPLDALFDDLLAVRGRIALNAGFANYRDYKFHQYHRCDYTPDDCKAFHEAAREILVPLQHEIWQRRATEMKLHPLRPWDLIADPLGLPPLKPYEDPGRFIDAMRTLFNRLDPDLGRQFGDMLDLGLLDFLSRKGKAPGGYQCTLDEARKPFIFMNAAGSDSDVRTLLHEAGHAFHALACADQPIIDYRHAPMEFCEVASMSMELLGAQELGLIYEPDALRRRQRHSVEMIVQLLLSIAVNDAFQHWIYENPGHSRDARAAKWVELQQAFGHEMLDWSGFEGARGHGWQRVLHFFQVPLYYIEYGIAQLGALGIRQRADKDFPAALHDYKQALALGGSLPLPQLFRAAGLTFDFSRPAVIRAAEVLRDEWTRSLPANTAR